MKAHAADVAEAAGGKQILTEMKSQFPELKKLWCDGGYGTVDGDFVQWGENQLHIAMEVVQKLVNQVGFVVLPRRWVVERTLAWFGRCRRLLPLRSAQAARGAQERLLHE